MGGDFILNKYGSVTFAYRSKTSTDRPSVDNILHALQVSEEIYGLNI